MKGVSIYLFVSFCGLFVGLATQSPPWGFAVLFGLCAICLAILPD